MLDTDAVIDVLRRRPGAQDRLHALGPVVVSAITAMELAYGVHRSSAQEANQRAVDVLLAFAPVVPFDDAAARAAGRIRSDLAAGGVPIGAYDVLIAGHAVSRQTPLATRNVGELGRVRALELAPW